MWTRKRQLGQQKINREVNPTFPWGCSALSQLEGQGKVNHLHSWRRRVFPSPLPCLRAPMQPPIVGINWLAENYLPLLHLHLPNHRTQYVTAVLQWYCQDSCVLVGSLDFKFSWFLQIAYIWRSKRAFLYLEQLNLAGSKQMCNFALPGQVFNFKLTTDLTNKLLTYISLNIKSRHSSGRIMASFLTGSE